MPSPPGSAEPRGALAGRTVVVSGGSAGIGLAIARGCAREGATLVIVARKQKDLADALGGLRELSDSGHRSYALDVADREAVRGFRDWLQRERLHPNGLVNCAGAFGPIGKTTELDMGAFAQALEVNLLGSVYLCQAVVPLFDASVRGKIINCGGGGATFPFPNYSAYAVSKVALVRFSENLALELAGDAVEVNCIAPGFVVTRLHEQTMAAGADRAGAFFTKTRDGIASGGVSAEKSAELAVFLLSKESDGISGKYISAAWDAWREPAFQERLRREPDFATLRRIDEQAYRKADA
jgi:NAD(P)-dependent dehydrogenase (short-subunit alcohol dehydrogenase family)